MRFENALHDTRVKRNLFKSFNRILKNRSVKFYICYEFFLQTICDPLIEFSDPIFGRD